MMGFSLLCSAAERFFHWVAEYEPTSKKEDPGWTPAQYMMQWLEFGESAVEAVIGDYTVFLQTLVIVTTECHRDPTMLDLVYTDDVGHERRVSRRPCYAPYLNPPMGARSAWIDQKEFDSLVYERHHKTGMWKLA
jgi:hypothetical protein